MAVADALSRIVKRPGQGATTCNLKSRADMPRSFSRQRQVGHRVVADAPGEGGLGVVAHGRGFLCRAAGWAVAQEAAAVAFHAMVDANGQRIIGASGVGRCQRRARRAGRRLKRISSPCRLRSARLCAEWVVPPPRVPFARPCCKFRCPGPAPCRCRPWRCARAPRARCRSASHHAPDS